MSGTSGTSSRGLSIEEQVDHLIDTRPGRELLRPVYDDPAVAVADGIYRSGGCTAAYMLLTDGGRVIVNTGMGFEAPHHRRVFDAVRPGPTHYVITTQGHVDHLGGVDLFKDSAGAGSEAVYVAQANNQACQADDARIRSLRMRTAGIWFDTLGTDARRIFKENPGVSMQQSEPVPDLTVGERLELDCDGLRIDLIAAVGETVDSLIVWLPERRTALVSNLFGPLFPHFPNLNTLRGDRYRFVEPYLESVRTVRALRPDVLVTGRHEPIVGADLIDASLGRLAGAVDYVHQRALEGFNSGTDVWTLMGSIALPAELRVGQGYGTVPWAVRTLWESYVGWFKLASTTELYPDSARAAITDLVRALGPAAALGRAEGALGRGDVTVAIQIAEALDALSADGGPGSPDVAETAGARSVLARAHTHLLERGGDVSFWENGWLRDQLARWGE
jgi:glyoxylase-like metal-dependent hydrolase (beta-lactamase superfamily II)